MFNLFLALVKLSFIINFFPSKILLLLGKFLIIRLKITKRLLFN